MRPSAKNTSDFGYKFHDLDRDGSDELFIIDLRFTDQYGIWVTEIYTLSNGVPKQIATGGERWNYYVVDSENVLGESSSGGAYTHRYTYYHLIDSELVAFETYTHDNGTWYFAEGEGCLNIPTKERQIIPEDKVYSEHPDTIGGIEALIFNEGYYLFSDYKVKDTQSNIAGNKCGDNAFWSFDEATETLTISGTGSMYDYGAIGYDENYPPWFSETYDENDKLEYQSNVKKLIVEEGITSLGKCAFSYCVNLESVQLPESLTEIRIQAFHNCLALKRISIPAGVKTIEDYSIGLVGNGDTETLENFVIYGYSNSAADLYAQKYGIDFIALDDFEEIPEQELTEQERTDLEFIKHHSEIANWDKNQDIWNVSEDLSTVYQLAEFDYYYGNTGVSFATEAYANIGNNKNIIEAGKQSRDIHSAASEKMYYQALLTLMYNLDEEELLNKTKEHYLNTLKDFSEIFNNFNTTISFSQIIKDVSGADSIDMIHKATEKLDDMLKLSDIPLETLEGNNLSVGALDILSFLGDLSAIKEELSGNISDTLDCITYFRMFCDLQDNYKDILYRMYESASDDNPTYKTALKNIHDCISVPDINSFMLNYVIVKGKKISADTSYDILSAVGTGVAMKLSEMVPGGQVLSILDTAGKIADICFDKMNSTEDKIISIGELVCYRDIIESLNEIGHEYSESFLEVQSLSNASAYHDIICLYYNALNKYCLYGNEFLNLFVSSYYSLEIDDTNNFADNAAIITRDNMVFKYIATTIENSEANDCLNDIFGLSDGNYFSWYKEAITLQTSIKQLCRYYNQPVCCIETTDNEINNHIEKNKASTSKNSHDFMKTFDDNWITAFIGCPVKTEIFNENGTLIAKVEDGDTDVYEPDSFMNILCYNIEENPYTSEDTTYGTLIMIPDNYSYNVTALEKCDVIIQSTDSEDLSGVTFADNEWESKVKKMNKGDVVRSKKSTNLKIESKDFPWNIVIVIGSIIIIVSSALVFVAIRKKI